MCVCCIFRYLYDLMQSNKNNSNISTLQTYCMLQRPYKHLVNMYKRFLGALKSDNINNLANYMVSFCR